MSVPLKIVYPGGNDIGILVAGMWVLQYTKMNQFLGRVCDLIKAGRFCFAKCKASPFRAKTAV